MSRGSKRKAGEALEEVTSGKPNLLASQNEINPSLAALFTPKANGPVAIPITNSKSHKKAKRTASNSPPPSSSTSDAASTSGSDWSSDEGDSENDEASEKSSSDSEQEVEHLTSEDDIRHSTTTARTTSSRQSRKRNRDDENYNLEGNYLQRLAREADREQAQRQAERVRQGVAAIHKILGAGPGSEDETARDEESDQAAEPLLHESLTAPDGTLDVDKSKSTVFLGNVSVEAVTSKPARKTLRQHLASILAPLNDAIASDTNLDQPEHRIETLYFRSTPLDPSLPKRVAAVTQAINVATSHSTNAYCAYSSPLAASTAAHKLNGTVILDRHLRVDVVSKPSKIDHKRCVFVGNLGFVDDASSLMESQEREEAHAKKKNKRSLGDVEEGLWRQFGKAGIVENVRVVRDSKTRVGKGFAYVQFTDPIAVETALTFNDQKFPPMLTRKLRVVRAKSLQKQHAEVRSTRPEKAEKAKPGAEQRLRKKQKRRDREEEATNKSARSGFPKFSASIKAPEEFVFEGIRASQGQNVLGGKIRKLRSGGKKGGAPSKPLSGKKSRRK